MQLVYLSFFVKVQWPSFMPHLAALLSFSTFTSDIVMTGTWIHINIMIECALNVGISVLEMLAINKTYYLFFPVYIYLNSGLSLWPAQVLRAVIIASSVCKPAYENVL